ncbi:hypothetical protein ACXC9Q_30305 [Kribbella sp. CWNU-51]
MNNPTEITYPHRTSSVAESNGTGWPPAHRDVTPAPQPIRNGQVVSVCSCGREFVGVDPDHADWQLIDHIDNNAETAN